MTNAGVVTCKVGHPTLGLFFLFFMFNYFLFKELHAIEGQTQGHMVAYKMQPLVIIIFFFFSSSNHFILKATPLKISY